jgi:endonuclease YncB( thermonuclease family)
MCALKVDSRPVTKRPGGAQYEKLVRDIKTLLEQTNVTGSQARNKDRLDAYWQIGKCLQHRRATDGIYLTHLARSLKISSNVMYRSLRFYRTWPDGLSANALRLTWGGHIVLASVTPVKERDFYLSAVIKKGWDVEKLRSSIHNDYYTTYHDAGPDAGLPRTADPLYVYKAEVLTVVDGDTLNVRLDLGFRSLSEQTLRLRGINASELPKPGIPSNNAARALRAKAYVTERLTGLPFIVVQTHKTDIYGRYVADVFYHPKLIDKNDVAKKGFFLNAELLREKLADRMMM